MSLDPTLIRTVRHLRFKTLRHDGASTWTPPALTRTSVWLGMIALTAFFVVLGAINFDLGPTEARLGLAAGETMGPVGQVFGYWAPDLWPAQVFPSLVLGRLEAAGRPSPAAIRWPEAIAAIVIGWMIARTMCRQFGLRAGLLFGVCWFGSLAVIDRSATTGIDWIMGLAVIAAIDRLITQGSDWVAGIWATVAFLAGGWPPLVVIALAVIVVGQSISRFSLRLLLPPTLTAIAWSAWTMQTCSVELWAATLSLPLTRKPDWSLCLSVLVMGLPWSPFSILALSQSVRQNWKTEGRSWLNGWLVIALAELISGSIVPGMSPATRLVGFTGLLIVTTLCLESAWARTLTVSSRRAFFVAFGCVFGVWLAVMLYGSYVWNLAMPFYRPLGIIMTIVALGVGVLGMSALETGNSRRGMVTLMVIAVGLKLAHWGYYVPESNYRYSQGPWGRAIGQWIPKKWVLYTFHDWQPDLAFFVKRPVRQLRSPHYLEYEPGPAAKFVLLQDSEFENWPQSAPPVTMVAKFLDQSARERVLARTAGSLPPPLGPNPLKFNAGRDNTVASE
jgi:hypothetical protein